MDAIAQLAHHIDMFDPVAVHVAQHDRLLKRHELLAHRLDLFLITAEDLVHAILDGRLAVLAFDLIRQDTVFLTHAQHVEALAHAGVIDL